MSRMSDFGPSSEVENFGTGYLRRDTDLNLVTTFTYLNDSWQDSGINKEPRADRLYVLGRKQKLDGGLMYWYSAVGTQCIKVHMDVYLIDLQTRTVYAEEGPKSDIRDMTQSLIRQFKNGRRALAGSP